MERTKQQRRARKPLTNSSVVGLKGQDMKAQGAALGMNQKQKPKPCKGDIHEAKTIPPLQGLRSDHEITSQGCALGYHITAFQASLRGV
jgi:hypothetical protein